MNDEPRVLQAADVYNATHDLPLYEWVASLESQNQALQEELRKYQPGQGEGWPDDRHEFAGRLTALREAAEALQERAEKAEDLLRAVAFDDQHKLQAWLEPLYIREPYVKVLVDKATELLSPTQETDPE